MGKPWNPPAATVAVWEAYIKRNTGHYKKAWEQIPAPKPSYPAFMKFAEKQWGLSKLQMARRKVFTPKPLETVQPINSAPPHPVVQIRQTDRALTLIAGAVKEDREPWEMIGRIRGILAMLGKETTQ